MISDHNRNNSTTVKTIVAPPCSRAPRFDRIVGIDRGIWGCLNELSTDLWVNLLDLWVN